MLIDVYIAVCHPGLERFHSSATEGVQEPRPDMRCPGAWSGPVLPEATRPGTAPWPTNNNKTDDGPYGHRSLVELGEPVKVCGFEALIIERR